MCFSVKRIVASDPRRTLSITTVLSHSLVMLFVMLGGCQANASVYLPLNLSPEIESRVERLFVQANIPVIKRPIPIKAVYQALEQLGDTDIELRTSITRYLDRYLARAAVNHFHIYLGAWNDASRAMPNARGKYEGAAYGGSFSAYWVPHDWVAVSVGGLAYERQSGQKGAFLDNTYLSLGGDWLRLDIGYRPHWFGPFQDSDMLISTNAPTMPSVTISNTLPFQLLGLRYELFLAEMSASENILSADGERRQAGKPRLLGIHLSSEPFSGFAIGVNRLMQFGGGDRDDAPGSVVSALVQPRDNDNRDPGENNDFGNQQSSITTRYTFAGEFPLSVYMEYAGEDTSGASGLALGNTAIMLGFHMPKLTNFLDLSYEYASWQNAWYSHSIYGDGMRHEGGVVGHWGGDNRQFSDGVGAQSHTTKVIWLMSQGRSLTSTVRLINNEGYAGSDYQKGKSLSLAYSHSAGSIIANITLSIGASVWGENYARLEGGIRW